jgi:hypothetical protein
MRASLRGAIATKQSRFPQANWIAPLALAMPRKQHRSRGALGVRAFTSSLRFKIVAAQEGGEAPKGAMPTIRRATPANVAVY